MKIGDLELLRKQILREIDKHKIGVVLGAVIFGVVVWLSYHSDFFIARIIRFAIYLPIASFVYDNFIMNKNLKTITQSSILLGMFIVIAITNNPRLFEFAIALFILIDMILLYKLSMKDIKIKKQAKFQKAFKEQFLKPHFAELGLEYKSDGKINLDELFNKSKLFAENISMTEECHNRGNDEICGEKEGVKFHLFDIELLDTLDDYLIYGVFFMAEFNKKAISELFIVSNEKHYDNFYGYKKVKMDDSEFNAHFSVYSNDTQNAMYILSPAFMKRVLDLKKRLKRAITASFVGNKIYIFVDTGKDSFEPNIDKSVLGASPAFAIKMELSRFLFIIEMLNLNTKIWKI